MRSKKEREKNKSEGGGEDRKGTPVRFVLRDGPLEKLWGGEGNFRAAGIFFRHQIPCRNFF